MHPEISQDKPGRCPICGMKLVEKGSVQTVHTMTGEKNNYIPLIVIVLMILLVTISLSVRDYLSHTFALTHSLSYFMIGFFLTFASFKLMDLKGFAQGYSTYDLLAKRVFAYGYVYPFIELFFGLAMIFAPSALWLLLAEIVIMAFSGLGVAIKLARHERFQCACLGTFLKVPLTKVTLIEDFGMVFLAILMLFLS